MPALALGKRSITDMLHEWAWKTKNILKGNILFPNDGHNTPNTFQTSTGIHVNRPSLLLRRIRASCGAAGRSSVRFCQIQPGGRSLGAPRLGLMTERFFEQEITVLWASPSSSLPDFNFSNSAGESLLRSRLGTEKRIDRNPEPWKPREERHR